MTQTYQCIQFTMQTLMQYGSVVSCNGQKVPQLEAKYCSQVTRRESYAAEACALEAGLFYAEDPARQYDLRKHLLICKVGSGFKTFRGEKQAVRGPGGKLYRQDEILELMFLNGVRICGLYGSLNEQPRQDDFVQFNLFLRSASMSRGGDLSFAAQEICDKVLERCSLGMLQKGLAKYPWAEGSGVFLSKFDAYMGLALSDSVPVRQLELGLPGAATGSEAWTLNEETVVVVSDAVFSNYQCGELHLNSLPLGRSLTKTSWPHNCYWEPDENGILKDQLVHDAKGNSKLTPFDGEGILSPAAAKRIRSSLSVRENQTAVSSFQIRMPLCKGVLHEVDFLRFLESGDSGIEPEYLECAAAEQQQSIYIRDLYERKRDLRKVQILMTESMFKCHKWVKACAEAASEPDPMKWYFDRLRQLQPGPQAAARKPAVFWVCRYNLPANQQGETTTTNYQILHTTGFDLQTNLDLTAASVQQYARLARADAQGDAERFARYAMQDPGFLPQNEDEAEEVRSGTETGETWLRRSMGRMPELMYTVRAKYSMRNWGEDYLKKTQLGQLELRGAVRFLSADLMTLLWALGINAALTANRWGQRQVLNYAQAVAEWELGLEEYDAPCVAPTVLNSETGALQLAALFRNPHMSREEHLLARNFADAHSEQAVELRRRYLGHLEGVVMLAARSMGAARLSGADFDGDIVRVITEPLYVQALYDSLARSQQEMGLEQQPGVLLPCLPLVNIKPPESGTGIKIVEQWLKEPQRSELRLNQYKLWDGARKNKVGYYSNLGVHFGALAYGFPLPQETDAQRAKRLQAELAVRRLTALVGYEIDSTKTGFVPELPAEMAVAARENPAFLKYKKDAGEYAKASIYRYYPSGVQKLLTGQPAQQGVLQAVQAGEPLCWLDLMPWYMDRSARQELAQLKKENDTHPVQYSAAQLRQALGLGGFTDWDAETRKLFVQLLALCKAREIAARKKDEKGSDAQAQIARILFMQQPQSSIESDRRQAEELVETVKKWYRQTESAQQAQTVAEDFCVQMAQPQLLKPGSVERSEWLRAQLLQLHDWLEPGVDAAEEIDVFVRLCGRTDHEGYRIPLLVAVAVWEWAKDDKGLALDKAYNEAETAARRLPQLCAEPMSDRQFEALKTNFAALLLRCGSNGERLQQLADLRQRLLSAQADGWQRTAELVLTCADPSAVTEEQLCEVGLSAEGAQAAMEIIKTESQRHKFLWDFGGAALYSAICRLRSEAAAEVDFARLRAELTQTGGEQA